MARAFRAALLAVLLAVASSLSLGQKDKGYDQLQSERVEQRLNRSLTELAEVRSLGRGSAARGRAEENLEYELEALREEVLTLRSLARSDKQKTCREKQGGDMHLAFITDCSYHQRWMATLLLHSAGRVGQTDPITWLRFGCQTDELVKRHSYELLLQKVYPGTRLVDIDDRSTGRLQRLPDISWIKPLAFQEFLSDHRITNDTVVAMLDADFIFMSEFRVDNLDKRSIASLYPQQYPSKKVQGMHGVVQRYECCRYSGAPYVFTAEAWRKLLPVYAGLKDKAHGDWGEEQEAFAKAAQAAGVTFASLDHFMISDLDAEDHEGWAWVKESIKAGKDKCIARVSRETDGPVLPTFLHVVRPIKPKGGSDDWQFSKYQVPPGWERPEGDGMLDCHMPLLAEPPTDFVQTATSSHGRASSREQLSAWMLCGVIHGINDMLIDVKRLKCPDGFNQARALKIEADWKNVLVQGPQVGEQWNGTDTAFVEKCVKLQCDRT